MGGQSGYGAVVTSLQARGTNSRITFNVVEYFLVSFSFTLNF